MKKIVKKKWLILALAATLIVAGAASLTAFGTDEQNNKTTLQMEKMQSLCTVDQNCFKRGTHHTQVSGNAATATQTATAPISTSQANTATSYCQYPNCDGTHNNHQNTNYGHHSEGRGNHGSSHGGGHHGGNHE